MRDLSRHQVDDFLIHYGISGMRWYVRRFQNEDGTLTEAGKKRYGYTSYEVKRNLDNAQRIAKEKRLHSDDLNSRNGLHAVFTTNDIRNAHAKRAAFKAEKKADQLQKVYDRLSEHERQSQPKNQNDAIGNNVLENRIKNFDKASTDEKFKIVDDVIKENNRIGREKGYNSPEFKRINDQYWELSRKAGKAKYDDIDRMPKGEKKDAEWEEYLRDPFANGQDSANIEPLLQRMQSRHGDYLSRNFKTEAGRKAAHDLDAASEESIRLDRKIRELQSKRRTKDSDYYENGESIFDKRTKTEAQIQKARDDYAKMVLKDMGMPINKNTIDYIWSIIIWN